MFYINIIGTMYMYMPHRYDNFLKYLPVIFHSVYTLVHTKSCETCVKFDKVYKLLSMINSDALLLVHVLLIDFSWHGASQCRDSRAKVGQRAAKGDRAERES